MISVPLTISLGTLISILLTAGKSIYNVGNLLVEGIGHVRSEEGRSLLNRCLSIIETLQNVDKQYITTARTQRLVQTLVNCLNWVKKYESMNAIRKVIFYKDYRETFRGYHTELTKYYYDMSISILLTGIFPNKNDPLLLSNRIEEG